MNLSHLGNVTSSFSLSIGIYFPAKISLKSPTLSWIKSNCQGKTIEKNFWIGSNFSRVELVNICACPKERTKCIRHSKSIYSEKRERRKQFRTPQPLPFELYLRFHTYLSLQQNIYPLIIHVLTVGFDFLQTSFTSSSEHSAPAEGAEKSFISENYRKS